MSTLIVELSDTQLHKLERLAQQRGTSIDALVREALAALAAQSEYDITQDPLYTIKAHETRAPADLSQHADHYLYGARKP
jgi:predicted transcriptional regulator